VKCLPHMDHLSSEILIRFLLFLKRTHEKCMEDRGWEMIWFVSRLFAVEAWDEIGFVCGGSWECKVLEI
jgi:hypothetical protein